MGLGAELVDSSQVGWFRIYATPPGGHRTEITMFRGVPITVSSLGSADPFGDTTAVLEMPQVTIFERPGQGDLFWLLPYTNIDIIWRNLPGYNFSWEWEGFIVDDSVSLGESGSGVTLECKGALFKLDNYLAKPTYPQQPIPYEILLREAFDPDTHPGCGTEPLRLVFPSPWDTLVPEFTLGARLWFLRPWGVTPGQRWTGITTRATGSFDPTLTSHVQALLAVMFDQGGAQWTIRKDRGRIPVLYLRRPPDEDNLNLLTMKMGTPGLTGTLSRDFTQSANVIYGAGTDVAGSVFSGTVISRDGTRTEFAPFAASPAVYPDDSNPRYNPNIARKEIRMDFPTGMDELTARDVAKAQYYRFADPGYTGSLTLTTDPTTVAGVITPRMLIRAGRGLLLQGFRGGDLLVHITAVRVTVDSGQVELTVDSKFRDQLTVAEVRSRTRDALTPVRLIKPGDFKTTTEDMLLPWSYAEGSGCLPVGAKELFTKKMSRSEQFPWTHATRLYPPKKFPQYYVKIKNNQRLTKCEKSWAMRNGSVEDSGIPIRMAQLGTIRQSQIAAYDADGNVLPVRFHVGVYNNRGVGIRDMPLIPALSTPILKPTGATYAKGHANPFYAGAFEQMKPDGALQNEREYLYHQSVGFQMGWGNYNEPAGYSPGLQSRGAPKTGLLQDEQTWGFNTTEDPNFDPAKSNMTPWKDGVGMLYVMIFCDDNVGPIYFLGRFFRVEPGQ